MPLTDSSGRFCWLHNPEAIRLWLWPGVTGLEEGFSLGDGGLPPEGAAGTRVGHTELQALHALSLLIGCRDGRNPAYVHGRL